MTTTQTTEARKAELFARATTGQLVQAMLLLEAQGKLDEEGRMVRAWTYGEIENRMGGVVDEDAFCGLLDSMSYGEALLVTFPALVA